MFSRSLANAANQALRSSGMRSIPRSTSRYVSAASLRTAGPRLTAPAGIRALHMTGPSTKGLSPETAEPQPKDNVFATHVAAPADISLEEYHERSEEFLDSLLLKLEELAEQREDVDVEYSAGVLTLAFPPNGTYVLNKQPPNKQIWLSSPISGPKRYDWVIQGESMHEKEGCGVGEWIYLRDGSTLSDLLKKELGVYITATDPSAA
ncbi:Frataxin [Xylona heveae TC161]|uniref:ferroxidase n=1 Tax=Xylona heveae (strain CBS 132557 / TC161) TaxID=1328760 RepID=A0A165A228_XYLHT|nr:Frataxin [Xylona heveae TC161]KZF19844.1 Frataxin [Xylona heveae TC161]